MDNLINKEAIKAQAGKHVANKIEYKVKELCLMAQSIGFRLVIDYKPRQTLFDVVVKYDFEKDLQLFLTNMQHGQRIE